MLRGPYSAPVSTGMMVNLFEWGYVLDVMLNDARQLCFRESKMQKLLLIQSENKNWSNETLTM